MADLSVIVVSYRNGEALHRCLRTLVGSPTGRSLEILVIDNDPEEDGAKTVGSFAKARLIQTERNLGYAGGVNRGLAAASGRHLMVLNPDVEMHPSALDGLADFLDTHPGSGLAAPKLLLVSI